MLRGHTKPKTASPLDQAGWKVWVVQVAAAGGSQLPVTPGVGQLAPLRQAQPTGPPVRSRARQLRPQPLPSRGLPGPSPRAPSHAHGAEVEVGPAWVGAAQKPSARVRSVLASMARKVGSH